jgi:hypothetical protein
VNRIEAYPLHWPAGWPRTPPEDRIHLKYRLGRSYSKRRAFITFGEARAALVQELDRFGASEAVLSTNHQLTPDGQLRPRMRAPADGGIALYFRLGERIMAMACDLHVTAADNIRSLATTLRALRQLEDHIGEEILAQALERFTLPSADPEPWWRILHLDANATRAEVEAAYRRLARERHPDLGGTDATMAELNVARDEAMRGVS